LARRACPARPFGIKHHIQLRYRGARCFIFQKKSQHAAAMLLQGLVGGRQK
jgi:hypothetical protein